METKKILGLDVGTNSIGAALIELPKSLDDYGKYGNIIWMGSRIIPVDADYLQKFETGGQVETKAAARRMKRGSRRLKHRYKLRRTRLIKVLKLIGWIPEDFPLDNPSLIKNIIRENNGRFEFKMKEWLPFSNETINEALSELGLEGKANEKGNPIIQEDWIVYYLRKKALSEKITLKEFARILYLMNQRRGFKSSRKDLQDNELISWDEFITIKKQIDDGELPEYKKGNGKEYKTKFVSNTIIEKVELKSDEKDKSGKYTFIIQAADKRIINWEEKRKEKPDWEGKEFRLLVEQEINKKGEIKQDSKPKIPKKDDWTLTMTALDNQIDESGKQVGEFFWDKLAEATKKNEIYKIRQNVIRREKYQRELKAIWDKQLELRKADGSEEELLNTAKLKEIAFELYKHNTTKQKELIEKGLFHILANDIIYYQRELKSQKDAISECRYEKRNGITKDENGNWIKTGIYGLKCCPKSSPLFQEFRIWQDIHNIRILQKEFTENGITKVDYDVTNLYLNNENKAELFDLFDTNSEVTEKKIFDKLNELINGASLNSDAFRINLFTNREKLKGNETKDEFRKIFKKFNWENEGEKVLRDAEKFFDLWHIVYSITSSDLEKSKKGIKKALKRFDMPEEIAEAISEMKEFKKEYASYSALAIRKLLSLMRCGKHWNWNTIQNLLIADPNEKTKKIKLSERLDSIIHNGWERDIKVDKRTGEIIEQRKFTEQNHFSGLPVWLAGYVVYGRHSERETTEKYTIEQIKSLNVLAETQKLMGNPLVKQVVAETMLLVRDVCIQYGQPDEIHIELGRELKKNAEQRSAIAEVNQRNLEEKRRVKLILQELLKGSFEQAIDKNKTEVTSFTVNPNPNNPTDVEIYRIYKSCGEFDWNPKEGKTEEQVKADAIFKDGKKERIPTGEEIRKYILWLSQKCVSPYTGKVIPLSKLFDETYYEKEHIIPRKKLKNDSMDNLIIAETGVNKAKGNELAANFISRCKGTCNYGGTTYKLFNYNEYVEHCKKTFKGKKLKNLLATEVPDDFIERQINDTRYIGKKIGDLLYPFAKEKEGLIFTIGGITSDLRKEWSLNKIWKKLLEPRFKRLESITDKQYIHQNQHDQNDIDFDVPEIKDLDIKRIDHRHHALDALIIAATTREHIRYLNSLNAVDTSEELQKVKQRLVKGKIRDFKLPWETFVKDAKEKLEEVVVTFKSNQRVVTKPYNRYLKWKKMQDGTLKKVYEEQKDNPRWLAVRKSLFKEPQGIIWIKEKREVKVKDAVEIQIKRMQVEHDSNKRKTAAYVYDQEARLYIKDIIQKTIDSTGIQLSEEQELIKAIEKHYLSKNKKGKSFILGGKEYEKIAIAEFVPYKAKRVKVDTSFNEDKISKIPYADKSRIPILLREHLREFGKPTEAFSEEGLEKLAKKNNNKPIRTVTVTDGRLTDEHYENLFGNKYVESDKGSIAYFVIYENEKTHERSKMLSVSAHIVASRITQGKPIVEPMEGHKIIMLQPNDLVYVPTDEEWSEIKQGNKNAINWSDNRKINLRIYKMVKSTGSSCYFIPSQISKLILPYDQYEEKGKKIGELESQNCSEKTMDDDKINIKERCIKLHVDRLGNIKPV